MSAFTLSNVTLPEPNNPERAQANKKAFEELLHKLILADEMKKEVQKLMADPDVTKKPGIYEYLLDCGKNGNKEKLLSIRTFGDVEKRAKYEEQDHKCAICGKEIKDIKAARADHIKAWTNGGRTILENCQVLCEKCNLGKSSKNL